MNQQLWDNRMLHLATVSSKWSKDPSTKVGAVIARGNRVVSIGFNGYPRGVHDKYVSREDKLLRTIHAEVNAILFAKQDLTDCTIYISLPPCAQCAALIIQSGITRVVYNKATIDQTSRWAESFRVASEMFDESGVEVCEM